MGLRKRSPEYLPVQCQRVGVGSASLTPSNSRCIDDGGGRWPNTPSLTEAGIITPLLSMGTAGFEPATSTRVTRALESLRICVFSATYLTRSVACRWLLTRETGT